ncbi:MAG: WD40 repeat domain-containing protein [Actinomycetota bacterium]|nr:WD40 repeat domain-containing protein [Actinomycetota bacterium]
MSDDKVRIDPMFASTRTYPEESRGLRSGRVIVAVGVAAFAVGWLFGAASSTPDPDGVAASTTTLPSADTTATTTSVRIVAQESGVVAHLDMALGEAIPGFTDTITLAIWNEEGVDVQRWRPESSTPETLLTFPFEESPFLGPPMLGWPMGLDASGYWHARVLPSDTLVVDSLSPEAVDGFDLATEAPIGEAIGVRVREATWHPSKPGWLAWLETSRGHDPTTATLRMLDVADESAQPAELLEIDLEHDAPAEFRIEWLQSGIQVEIWTWEDDQTESARQVLVDADGTVVAQPEDSWFSAEGPDGTTLWTPNLEFGDSASEPFLLTPDGLQRSPVPGSRAGDRISSAEWSPDGGYLALGLGPPEEGSPLSAVEPARFRVIDLASGTVLVALDVHGYGVSDLEWSPDGRYVAASTEWEDYSTIRIVELGDPDAGIDHRVTEIDTNSMTTGPLLWSTNGRFLLAPAWQEQTDANEILIHDVIKKTTTQIPISGHAVEVRLGDWRPPVDPGGNPSTTLSDDEGLLVGTTEALPLGERTTLPESARLDFLNTVCEGNRCFRDAELYRERVEYTADGIRILDREGEQEGEGGWSTDAPFHVFHGFVNEGDEPLGPGYQVVLYVTRRNGPDLPDERFLLDQTYRYYPDFVLRGETAQCGPDYREQSSVETCEWFVHDFPDGLPAGRYDLWAKWFAPCSKWEELGLEDSCDDPNEVMSRFAGSVNMPFGGW